MKKEDYIYKPKIDSGKLFIPLEEVQLIKPYLFDELITKSYSKTTGEEYEELEVSSKGAEYVWDNEEDGTYVRFGVNVMSFDGLNNSKNYVWV